MNLHAEGVRRGGKKVDNEVEQSLDWAKELLPTYLAAHPFSEIARPDPAVEGVELTIRRPWDDSSLVIHVPREHEALFEALENTILPERLSAIWHRDTRKLEVIWTARRLQEQWQEVIDRRFEFIFQGEAHTCHFTSASERLLTIAEHVRPESTSETSFRNMTSFAQYVSLSKSGNEIPPAFDRPICFWIDNVDYDETTIYDLINSLNFYLTYYDHVSPIVMVHDISKESKQVIQRTRYLKEQFPKKITARPLDQNLVAFWQAASGANQMMKFILYYRMIEYCAGQFIEHSVRSELKRIISAPDMHDDIHGSVERIVNAVSLKQLEDIQRFRAVVRHNVDPQLLWQDVHANRQAFSKDTTFDGGFSIKPLIGPNEDQPGFCNRSLDQFSDCLRKIRNALSHGKDQESAGVILPTPQNMDMLRPWVHLIATAAGEVVLYKDIS